MRFKKVMTHTHIHIVDLDKNTCTCKNEIFQVFHANMLYMH